jgi:hypothetical protein
VIIHFAPLHGEGNVVDGQFGAERLAQLFNFNHSNLSNVGQVDLESGPLIIRPGGQKQALPTQF